MTRLLWKNRELIRQFTLRNIELRHKGSHLGLIWSFLQPLLMLAMYVMVFGYIFEGSFGVVPGETKLQYGLGVFLGLTLFHFVSEVLGGAPAIIVGNPNFVKKVVFPLEVLPVASVLGATFHLLVSLVMVFTGIIFLGPGLTAGAIWVPVIVLPLVLTMLGVSWLVSALGVFLRDINQMVPFLSMALMWGSAVFYSVLKLPAAAWVWMRFNPLMLAIEQARDVALWGRPANLNHILYLYAFSLVACFCGYVAFRRMKPAFADVL